MINNPGSPIPPPGPLAYEGISAVPFIVRTLPVGGPLPTFRNFNVPTIWVNPTTKQAWLLVSISNSGTPFETWILLGTGSPAPPSGPTQSLTVTTDTANPVFPTTIGSVGYIPGTIGLTPGAGVVLTAAPSATTPNITIGLVGGGAGVLEINTPTGGPVIPAAGVVDFLNGTGMDIVGSGSSVTFNAPSGGVTWNYINAPTFPMMSSNGYMCDGAGQILLTLPTSGCVRGSVIEVATYNSNAFGWKITQTGSQKIQYGNIGTTIGLGGSLASISAVGGDAVKLLCTDDNLNFVVLSSIGDLTVT